MKIIPKLIIQASCALGLLLQGCATPPPPPPKVVLALAQTERGVSVWLPSSVLFEFGKADLNLAEAGPYLDRVAQLLRDKTAQPVILEGHTDSIGSAEANQLLSEKRAQTIYTALRERQVPNERMSTKGLGLSQPLAPNDVEVGRKVNRRVEVVILNEKVENLTRGEPANAFEDAFAKLKQQLAGDLSQKAK